MDFGKDFLEFSAKSSLIVSGNNVVPPSAYIADNEERWMPKQETKDVFYEVLPSIALLSVNQRIRILRALVYSLLPPLDVMEFNDTTHFELFKFLDFLNSNPEYRAKQANDADEMHKVLDPFAKRMAKKKIEDLEREKQAKEIANRLSNNLEDNDDE